MIVLLPVRAAPISLFLLQLPPGSVRLTDDGAIRSTDDGGLRATDIGTLISDDGRQHVSDDGLTLSTDS